MKGIVPERKPFVNPSANTERLKQALSLLEQGREDDKKLILGSALEKYEKGIAILLDVIAGMEC